MRESSKAPKTLNFYDQPSSSGNEGEDKSRSMDNDGADNGTEIIYQGAGAKKQFENSQQSSS